MTTTVTRPVAARDWTSLGCLVRVVVTRPAALDDAAALLDDALRDLDAACSRFRPDAEITMLDSAAGATVAVSPTLAGAVAAGLRGARLTDGDVDPTLGHAMADAGYDRDFALLPGDGPAVHVRRRPIAAWQDIRLDPERRTVSVPAGVRLDLGATAKAYAADRAARRIAEALDTGVLVSLGGDIAVAGAAPADGWAVRVQDVTSRVGEPPTGPATTVAIRTGGLATSSVSARRWVRGGRVMHHILDPRSGVPVASPWRTVSVVAASCLDANIASTASIVRGEHAVDWLRRLGLSARLVDTASRVTVVGSWPEESS